MLMVNSNNGRIVYRLWDICAYGGWQSPTYCDCK